MADLSTARTRLAPTGTPGQPWGTFGASEPVGGRPADGQFSRLTPAGLPGRLYGSFSGKAVASADTKPSTLSTVPRATIGAVTDVEIQHEWLIAPRGTLVSLVTRTVLSSLTAVPRATVGPASIFISGVNKTSVINPVPRATLVSGLTRPQSSALTAVPVATMASSVDTAAIEKLSSLSAIPVATMASSVTDLFVPKSSTFAPVPVSTLQSSINKINANEAKSDILTAIPRASIRSRVSYSADVDKIKFTARPFGRIEIKPI